jgi:hypothetical protein
MKSGSPTNSPSANVPDANSDAIGRHRGVTERLISRLYRPMKACHSTRGGCIGRRELAGFFGRSFRRDLD